MNLRRDFVTIEFSKRMLARSILFGMLIILPACGIPAFRQPESSAPVPETFNGASSAENSANLSAQEFFHDPTLVGLIDQALLNNRELKILDEEVQVARAEVISRQGTYLPFVTFGANAGLNKFSTFTLPASGTLNDPFIKPDQFLPNPLPNFNYGLNLFWQLDIWRELRNARDSAIQRYAATVERRNYFTTRLVAEIAEKYYQLMALDKRIENLNQIISLQQQSLKAAKSKFDAGAGTELYVQRFLAEVRKNESEKLIVRQDIVEAENRINFLLNRLPQPVERNAADFYDLKINVLNVGIPSQLLQNRPDIRQAERELEAAGLDVLVARARFFPKVSLFAGVGYEAFNLKYIFYPEALIYNAAANLVAPIINKKAIQADYMGANARQLQAAYNYQRTVLNAYTEVINRLTMVANYSESIEIKKQQLKALESSVQVAVKLYLNAKAENVDVLLAQRDLNDARLVLIDTKRQQLAAIVSVYQGLGGGVAPISLVAPAPPPSTFGDIWHLWRHPWSDHKTVR